MRHLEAKDLLAAVVAAAEAPAERLFEERRDRADPFQDVHARPRDADGAAAVVEGVLAIDQHAADAVSRQHQRRGHADRAGADDDDGMPCRRAVKLGHVPRRKDRIIEIKRIQRTLAGRSHAFLRLSLPVEKSLHQPLRLAGQERLPEHADAEIDGFRQRQLLPLPQQRLLRRAALRGRIPAAPSPYARPRHRGRRRRDHIDQPPGQRGRRVDIFRRHHQPAGTAPADQPRQQRGMDHRGNADADLGHAEFGVMRGDPEIAGGGDFQAAAEAPAGQPRDHGRRETGARPRRGRAAG